MMAQFPVESIAQMVAEDNWLRRGEKALWLSLIIFLTTAIREETPS